MIIKIDIDGVIRDTFAAMCNTYNNMFGTKLSSDDICSYDTNISFPLIKEKLGIDGNEFFFDQHIEESFICQPLDGAVDAINRLRAAGHHVAICSHQPKKRGRDLTLKFLEMNDIHYDSLHFTREKWLVKSHIIIDDCPDFLEDVRDTSIRFCVSYPFNHRLEPPAIQYRVNTLKEAADIILEKFPV